MVIILLSIIDSSCDDFNGPTSVNQIIDKQQGNVSTFAVSPTPINISPTIKPKLSFVKNTPNSIRRKSSHVDVIVDTVTLVNKPGFGIFHVPDTLKAEFTTTFVTQPSIVLAKDAYVREKNSLSISSFSKLQGLNDNVINVIYMDSKRNMWLGTDGGVVKFDGKWFTTYSVLQGLPSNEVISIVEDRQGNLWFGHYKGGGVSMFNGEKIFRFKNVPALETDCLWSVFEDSIGNIWFGTLENGVYKYNGEIIVHYGEKQGFSNNASAIIEDKNHNLLFATGKGICRFDGISFSHLFSKTVLCDNNYVNSLCLDRNDNVWFGSSKGVYKYDNSQLLHYTLKSGLSDKFVTSIYEDVNGVFWFGTDVGGVSRFDGEYFSHITMKDGLTNNTIFSILEDDGGNMWFGTWTGGLCKYSGDLFTHQTTYDGLPENNIISLAKDDQNTIWLGTWDNGLFKFIDGYFYTADKSKIQDKENPIYSIMKSKDNYIWLGCENGICRLKDGKMEWVFDSLPELIIKVQAICEDHLGNIWFTSTNRGLVKWVKKDDKFYAYSSDHGLPSNNICSVFEDSNGLLWIGTADKGFGYLNGDSLSWFNGFTDEKPPMIYAITEDRLGNIWFGSRGKALFVWCSQSISNSLIGKHIPPKTFKINNRLLLNLTTQQGLSGNLVNAVITTKEGNLIVGTDFGLSVVNRIHLASDTVFIEKITSPDKLLFDNYGYSDGFLGVGVNFGNNGRNIIQSRSGDFWIAANNMVTRFNPNNRIEKKVVPTIQIVGIELSSELIDWFKFSELKLNEDSVKKYISKDTLIQLSNGVVVRNCKFDSLTHWNSLPYNLSLSYKNNYLTFNYVGSSVSDSHKLKYQYILEGFDDQWSNPTNITSVSYANLLPKSYTFRVKAMNKQGDWSDPVSFFFTIRPPWWQTNWFYTSSIILFILLLYITYRIRTASLHATQRRLKMEIDIATLEISNSNAILIQQYDELTQKSFIVSEQKEELEAQRDAISSQKSELEMVYNELNKSIDYAMQIQYNVLPDFSEVKQFCDGYFIFFKPRDFVSGDFYWCTTVEGRLILTVADCTGHGVPGGFMSMLGMTYLNQIVTKEYITQPEVILKKLRREIVTTLKQSGNFGEHKDGMDISLCSIDVKTFEMQWAGAYNPCIIIRDGVMIEIKGDKMPIGIHDRMDKFTLHHFQLKKGDLLYLFSDGYGDQFGGPNDKRYSSKDFKNLLLKISSLSMDDQFNELDSTLSSWMSGGSFLNEQIDDITVVGVRL